MKRLFKLKFLRKARVKLPKRAKINKTRWKIFLQAAHNQKVMKIPVLKKDKLLVQSKVKDFKFKG